MSYLPLVGRTHVQVTQDHLGSHFVVHPLVSGAVVGGSGDKRRRDPSVGEHVWQLAHIHKINSEGLVGWRSSSIGSSPPPAS